MKNYGIISAANLPLSMVGNQVPFDMVSIAQSALASSHEYSLPNWAHTTGDDGDVVAPALDDDSAGLSPTYSTPREASAAYQSGLLKSDSKITSSHRKIRLAIRYLLLEEEVTDSSHLHGGPTDCEDLFLCWINQDGSPHHFRRMRPLRCVVAGAENPPNTGAGDVICPGGVPYQNCSAPQKYLRTPLVSLTTTMNGDIAHIDILHFAIHGIFGKLK